MQKARFGIGHGGPGITVSRLCGKAPKLERGELTGDAQGDVYFLAISWGKLEVIEDGPC